MRKTIFLTLFIILWSIHAKATEFVYQGKVKGMVCAFCVYSVGKNIAKVPGVLAQSVNIDLKSGTVSFRSSAEVSFKKVSSVFSGSGFKLVELNKVTQPTLKTVTYKTQPVINLNLNSVDLKTYGAVIESIGNIAASVSGKIVINAPASAEIAILRPMIGGKQKTIKIQYIADKNNAIQIKLFQRLE